MNSLRKLERVLFASGLLMLALYGAARIDGAMASRSALRRFENEQLRSTGPAERAGSVVTKPDFSLWSEKRISGYYDSLRAEVSPVIAILRIPKIGLEVPVLEGTDDLVLNRGVGRIQGTAPAEGKGNIGIAGHRDGFFRGLKDIDLGDKIELVTAKRVTTYAVDWVLVVDPKDVSVLAPSRQPALTLVTCYPFYFVGSAPQRYIVHGSVVRTAREPTASRTRSNDVLEHTAVRVGSKNN